MSLSLYLIGDSVSVHYRPYLEALLPGRLDFRKPDDMQDALLNLDDPQGANCGDSRRVLKLLRAKAEARAITTDLLLLNCGLHDIKRDPRTGTLQVEREEYEANLRAIVREVAAMPTQLVWLRTTPCDDAVHNRPGMDFHRFAEDCRDYNATADAVMAQAGVPVIDLHTFTLRLGGDLYCDHVHFIEPVRERQAAYIAGWVEGFESGQSAGGTKL